MVSGLQGHEISPCLLHLSEIHSARVKAEQDPGCELIQLAASLCTATAGCRSNSGRAISPRTEGPFTGRMFCCFTHVPYSVSNGKVALP